MKKTKNLLDYPPQPLVVCGYHVPKPDCVHPADPQDTPPTDRLVRRDGETKICPRCAERVKSAAAVCRHCGADFQAIEAAPAT
jgi:hypothetical protein